MTSAWLAFALPAAAQPTAQQQDALRQSCRSDFMSNCSGVKRGGAEALQCLQRNVAKLSPACRTAVDALTPPAPAPAAAASPPAAAAPPRAAEPPAPAAPSAATPAAPAAPARTAAPAPAAPAKPTAAQQDAMRQSCRSDFMSNCSGVSPGGAEALQCLQRNAAKLSPACKSAVAAIAPTAPAAPAAPARTAAPAPAAPAPAAAAPAQPTAAQQNAMRQSCRNDFMSKCSGVSPGGAEALQCLQRNAAALSPACRSAVAAIGGAPASAPATAAAPAAAPAAGAPIGPVPPRVELMVARACALERRTVCELPPGGGRILTCLAANEDRITPGCKAALAQARAAAR